MSHTIFGRHASNSRVTTDELFFMWCIVHRRRVNTGVWLLTHFRKCGRDIRGPIVGAGLITHLAKHYGFEDPHPTMQPAVPSMQIDLAMCKLGQLCRVEQGRLILIGPDGVHIQPPPPLENPGVGGFPEAPDDDPMQGPAPQPAPQPDPPQPAPQPDPPQPAPQPAFAFPASSSTAPLPQSSAIALDIYQRLQDYMEHRMAIVVQQIRGEHDHTRQVIDERIRQAVEQIRADFQAQLAALRAELPQHFPPPPFSPAADD